MTWKESVSTSCLVGESNYSPGTSERNYLPPKFFFTAEARVTITNIKIGHMNESSLKKK